MLKKALIIAEKEYRDVVQKKSFLIGALVTPVIIGTMMFLPMLLAKKSETPKQRYVVVDLENEGYGEKFHTAMTEVTTPDGTQQFIVEDLERYSSPESTEWLNRRKVLDSLVQVGELDGALIIYPGTLENDSLIVVSKSFDFKALNRAEDAMTSIVVTDRLSNSDINLPVDSIVSLTASLDIQVETPSGKRRDFGSIWMVTMVIWMLMYMTTLLYGQGVMRSVIEEKNSRIVEVMVSSVRPFDLMLGKLIGISGATLTQLLLWMALGVGARYMLPGDAMSAALSGAGGIVFNPVFVVFFAVFFILGFLLYSTMFAAIGSIVSTEKEAQNFMFPIIMLLIIPMLVGMSIAQSPSKDWVVALSLVPFLTPILMVMRINMIDPSAFTLSEPIVLQAFAGVILVVLTLALMTWLSGRIFRVGLLMTGKRATFPEIVRWIRQK